jgi:radical SAM-linked protein
MLSKGNLLREPRAIRIKFAKTGKLRYISHLDLCRTLNSAFLRSGIPIWYSQGFNPRPKMVFALTVSVGAESVAEYLDIRITNEMSESEIAKRLQAAVTPDLAILEVYRPTTKLQDVEYSEYAIYTEHPLNPEAVAAALKQPMLVMVHGKKGDKEKDIIPQIASVTVSGDRIDARLAAGQGNFLNPENFIKGLLAALGDAECFYQICRTACYTADGTPFR